MLYEDLPGHVYSASRSERLLGLEKKVFPDQNRPRNPRRSKENSKEYPGSFVDEKNDWVSRQGKTEKR